jgi:uncharacterized membrane protein YfcA
MDAVEAGLLFSAAALGGALNSVAGGGSFLTFPALIFAGIEPISANATSTVALWPGSVASSLGYRVELKAEAANLRWLAALSALGGLLGALTLIGTPKELFERLLPFLLLLATVVFTFGDALRARMKAGPLPRPVVAALQLAISIYGGYFGGGMGMMMLAAFTFLGMTELHRMNALKSALGVVINGVAVAAFVAAGKIAWVPAGVMVVGAVVGGFGGAFLARKVPPARLKPAVVLLGWAMTSWFFWRAFGVK